MRSFFEILRERISNKLIKSFFCGKTENVLATDINFNYNLFYLCEKSLYNEKLCFVKKLVTRVKFPQINLKKQKLSVTPASQKNRHQKPSDHRKSVSNARLCFWWLAKLNTGRRNNLSRKKLSVDKSKALEDYGHNSVWLWWSTLRVPQCVPEYSIGKPSIKFLSGNHQWPVNPSQFNEWFVVQVWWDLLHGELF